MTAQLSIVEKLGPVLVQNISRVPVKDTKINKKRNQKLHPKVLPKVDSNLLIRGCVDSLVTLLKTFDVNLTVCTESLGSTYTHWEAGAKECGTDGWMKYAKYKFAAYFHYHSGKQLGLAPEKPFGNDFGDLPGKLACGRLGRYCDRLARGRGKLGADGGISFLAGILQLKKGCPRPTEPMVKAAQMKTFEALTKERKDTSNDVLDVLSDIKDWGELSERAEEIDAAGHDSRITRQSQERELRRTVRELFKGKEYSDLHRYHAYHPSTKASAESTIRSGGAAQVLNKALNTMRKQVNHDDKVYRGTPGVTMTIEPKHRLDPQLITRLGLQAAPEGIRPYFLEPLGVVHGMPVLKLDATSLRAEHKQFYQQNLKEAVEIVKNNFNIARTVGLSEALKIRIITKGKAILQHVLKPLQKFMHGILRRHPTFELIGSTPVDEIKIQNRLGAKLGPDEYYNSGDYSNATNELHSWVSDTIVDEISKACFLTDDEKLCFHASLTGHLIQKPLGHLKMDERIAEQKTARTINSTIIDAKVETYVKQMSERAEGKGEEKIDIQTLRRTFEDQMLEYGNTGRFFHKGIEYARQRNGQLMGSIVSFPVLCIANAALTRQAIEMGTGRRLKLKETTIMINGDDVLSRMTYRTYQYWEKITAYAGLASSIGKTFLCKEFCQINSVNFQRLSVPEDVVDPVSGITRACWFKKTPYVNLGLLMGMKRSGEVGVADVTGDDDGVTMGTRCRELIRAALPSQRVGLMREYLRHHKEVLGKVRVPMYIHERWGGIGLPSVFAANGEQIYGPTTDLDQRICARLKEQPGLFPILCVKETSDWLTHVAVMNSMPDHKVISSVATEEMKSQFTRAYSNLCVSVFSRTNAFVNVQIHDLKDKEVMEDAVHIEYLPEGEEEFKRPVSKRTAVAVLRHNEGVWKKVLHQGNLPPPLAMDTIFSTSPDKLLPLVEFVEDPILPARGFEELANHVADMGWD